MCCSCATVDRDGHEKRDTDEAAGSRAVACAGAQENVVINDGLPSSARAGGVGHENRDTNDARCSCATAGEGVQENGETDDVY